MRRAEQLARAERGSVVAPAGCGKTELIVRAVEATASGRALVLTHTHAGVRALRERLARRGVRRDRAQVDTIAGWCLRFATAYPIRSGLVTPEPTRGEWDAVYDGAASLLEVRAIRRVVQASYSSVFVDEYQDCNDRQHRVILALATLLPCRVLGDPLQGIFAFAGRTLSWRRDIATEFPLLFNLDEPWRWKDRNEALGLWLLGARDVLASGNALDLADGPVRWVQRSDDAQRTEAMRAMRLTGSTVAIRKWPNDSHSFARSVGGLYSSMEEMDCSALLAVAEDLDRLRGSARAKRVLEFATECLTKVSTSLASIDAALSNGELPMPARYRSNAAVAAALLRVAQTVDLEAVRDAMNAMQAKPGAKPFRRELWDELGRAIAAWAARNRARSGGRRLDQRLVSRTLLIKGLEFDNALVLNANEFENPRSPGEGAKNFYVAMTRAARELVILSEDSRVRFSKPTL
jgi:hypothetical protein